MFRSTVILLTTATVMFHALLGCCAHHGHSHSVSEKVTFSVHDHVHSDDHSLDHCHSHSEHENVTRADTVPAVPQPCDGEHGPCDEADCQFVSTLQTDDCLASLSFSIFLALNASLPTTNALVSPLNWERIEQSMPLAATPSPLHALKQVWLL